MRNTPNVTVDSLVRNDPYPIQQEEIDALKNVHGVSNLNSKSISKGSTVQITDGPFKNQEGKVSEIDQNVESQFLFPGRETPVELDFLQLKGLG